MLYKSLPGIHKRTIVFEGNTKIYVILFSGFLNDLEDYLKNLTGCPLEIVKEILEVEGKQKKPLTHRLRAMVRDKQLSCNREGECFIPVWTCG
jgi:hypothetical protein